MRSKLELEKFIRILYVSIYLYVLWIYQILDFFQNHQTTFSELVFMFPLSTWLVPHIFRNSLHHQAAA